MHEVEERGLIHRAAAVGGAPRAGLDGIAARCPIVGEVRGRGLLLGIELVRDRSSLERFGAAVDPADAVRGHGAREGLLVYSRRRNAGLYCDWIVVAPAARDRRRRVRRVPRPPRARPRAAAAELLG